MAAPRNLGDEELESALFPPGQTTTKVPSRIQPDFARFREQLQVTVCGDFYCDSSGRIVAVLPAYKMDAGDTLSGRAARQR